MPVSSAGVAQGSPCSPPHLPLEALVYPREHEKKVYNTNKDVGARFTPTLRPRFTGRTQRR